MYDGDAIWLFLLRCCPNWSSIYCLWIVLKISHSLLLPLDFEEEMGEFMGILSYTRIINSFKWKFWRPSVAPMNSVFISHQYGTLLLQIHEHIWGCCYCCIVEVLLLRLFIRWKIGPKNWGGSVLSTEQAPTPRQKKLGETGGFAWQPISWESAPRTVPYLTTEPALRHWTGDHLT